MALRIKCEHCGTLVNVDSAYAGGKAPCPECGSNIHVTLSALKNVQDKKHGATKPNDWKKTGPLPYMREVEKTRKIRKRRTEILRRELEEILPPKKDEE